MKLEKVPISSLKRHPRNYREHPLSQLMHIEQSIKDHGMYRNIVVSKDDYILAGHGVTECLTNMGEGEVAIHRVDLMHDDVKAIKLLVADNELGHFAEVDDRILTDMLSAINEASLDDLLGTGFSEDTLIDRLISTRTEDEIADKTKAGEKIGATVETSETVYDLKLRFVSDDVLERFMELYEFGEEVVGNPIKMPYVRG